MFFDSESQLVFQQVAVFGDVGLDEYLIGNVSRISPEAPLPVVHLSERDTKPGLAANVAVNINALGGQSYLFGAVGEDEAGRELESKAYRFDKDLLDGSGPYAFDEKNSVGASILRVGFRRILRVVYPTVGKPDCV